LFPCVVKAKRKLDVDNKFKQNKVDSSQRYDFR
jgi:hypothetical protein